MASAEPRLALAEFDFRNSLRVVLRATIELNVVNDVHEHA